MIDTSAGSFDLRAPYLTPFNIDVRSALQKDIKIQTDGTRTIISKRNLPKVQRKQVFTYMI